MKKEIWTICEAANNYCSEEDKSVPFQLHYTADMITEAFPEIEFDEAHDMAMDYLMEQNQ